MEEQKLLEVFYYSPFKFSLNSQSREFLLNFTKEQDDDILNECNFSFFGPNKKNKTHTEFISRYDDSIHNFFIPKLILSYEPKDENLANQGVSKVLISFFIGSVALIEIGRKVDFQSTNKDISFKELNCKFGSESNFANDISENIGKSLEKLENIITSQDCKDHFYESNSEVFFTKDESIYFDNAEESKSKTLKHLWTGKIFHIEQCNQNIEKFKKFVKNINSGITLNEHKVYLDSGWCFFIHCNNKSNNKDDSGEDLSDFKKIYSIMQVYNALLVLYNRNSISLIEKIMKVDKKQTGDFDLNKAMNRVDNFELIKWSLNYSLIGLQGQRSEIAQKIRTLWQIQDLENNTKEISSAVQRKLEKKQERLKISQNKKLNFFFGAIASLGIIGFFSNMIWFSVNVKKDKTIGLIDLFSYFQPDVLLYISLFLSLVYILSVIRKKD